MDNLKLIENKVAFTFLEDSEHNGFSQTTASGIIVKQDEEQQVKQARWGEVVSCAPSVTEVAVGDYILIEPLGWTTALELEEVEIDKFWMTTEDRIMAVTSTEPSLI